MEVNGPYIIEDFSVVRDATNKSQCVLVLTAGGGEQFTAPMGINQLKVVLDRLRRELEDS